MADIGQTRLALSPSIIARLPVVAPTTIRTAIRLVLDTPRWPTQRISQFIRTPVLLSGARSYPFLAPISEELAFSRAPVQDCRGTTGLWMVSNSSFTRIVEGLLVIRPKSHCQSPF